MTYFGKKFYDLLGGLVSYILYENKLDKQDDGRKARKTSIYSMIKEE